MHSKAEPRREEEILRCHARDYVERVLSIDRMGWLDVDTIVSETTPRGRPARGGNGNRGGLRGGFALVRPPGHHALRQSRDGLLRLQQRRVAARAAQAGGAERVAIVDYDVHHGNGTQEIFAADDTVLFVSLHQWPFYPGSGGPDEQSETTVNVPLSARLG